MGFDPAERHWLVDLTAVAMTRVAWRDSPVEDWHALGRMPNPDMMRANAVMTRRLRDVLELQVPKPPVGYLPRAEAERMLTSVHAALTDPDRRLPDGRTLLEFASGRGAWAQFDQHVRDCCGRWREVLAESDLSTALLLFGCIGARYCSRWWLTPGWPLIVEEFVRRLADPTRWPGDFWGPRVQRLGPPPEFAGGRLRELLLEGPDRLTAATARHCLSTGLGDLFPYECGLPRLTRRILPLEYRQLIEPPPR